MGISQAIAGLGGIVYPIGIELMMEEYGFRGNFFISDLVLRVVQGFLILSSLSNSNMQ